MPGNKQLRELNSCLLVVKVFIAGLVKSANIPILSVTIKHLIFLFCYLILEELFLFDKYISCILTFKFY